MTNAPTITVASRAHRALRNLGRFKFGPDAHTIFPLVDHTLRGYGEVVGVYENPPGVDPAFVVVTDRALGCAGAGDQRWILFDDIATTHGPAEKLVDDAITIVLKSGTRTQIRIADGDGRFKDVFSFVRFIDRVIEDRKDIG